MLLEAKRNPPPVAPGSASSVRPACDQQERSTVDGLASSSGCPADSLVAGTPEEVAVVRPPGRRRVRAWMLADLPRRDQRARASCIPPTTVLHRRPRPLTPRPRRHRDPDQGPQTRCRPTPPAVGRPLFALAVFWFFGLAARLVVGAWHPASRRLSAARRPRPRGSKRRAAS